MKMFILAALIAMPAFANASSYENFKCDMTELNSNLPVEGATYSVAVIGGLTPDGEQFHANVYTTAVGPHSEAQMLASLSETVSDSKSTRIFSVNDAQGPNGPTPFIKMEFFRISRQVGILNTNLYPETAAFFCRLQD